MVPPAGARPTTSAAGRRARRANPYLPYRRRRRRRLYLALVLTLAVLAAALEAADVVTRHLAESSLATRAISATGASQANVGITGWPFLYDALAVGSLPGVTVQLRGVPVGNLRIERVDAVLRAVRIDRHFLIAHQRIRITGISSAKLTATVTAAELSAAANRTILLPGPGVIEVESSGQVVRATVAITKGRILVVRALGATLLNVDLSTNRVLSDCNLSLTVLKGAISASCSLSTVPKSLLPLLSAGG